jgi:hypothetical protein
MAVDPIEDVGVFASWPECSPSAFPGNLGCQCSRRKADTNMGAAGLDPFTLPKFDGATASNQWHSATASPTSPICGWPLPCPRRRTSCAMSPRPLMPGRKEAARPSLVRSDRMYRYAANQWIDCPCGPVPVTGFPSTVSRKSPRFGGGGAALSERRKGGSRC